MSRQYDFIGANKQAYTTVEDANKYGGGCIGKIALAKPVLEPIILPVEERSADLPVEAPKEESAASPAPSVSKNVPIAELSDEQLKEMAKEKGIRGFGIMKREKLIEKLSII